MLVYVAPRDLKVVVNDLKLLCLAIETAPNPDAMYPHSWMLAPVPGQPHRFNLITKGIGTPQTERLSYHEDPAASSKEDDEGHTPHQGTWVLHRSKGAAAARDRDRDRDRDREDAARSTPYPSLQHLVAGRLRPLLAATGDRAFIPPVVLFEWIRHPKFGSRSPEDMQPKNLGLHEALLGRRAGRVELLPAPFGHPRATHVTLVRVSVPSASARKSASHAVEDPDATCAVFMLACHPGSKSWVLFDPSPTAAWARVSQCLDALLGTLVMDP
jgi:hypothetical protein